jgi:hypothetical protein
LFVAHYGKIIALIGTDGLDLLVLDEDLAYSLVKERTATKLFTVEYKKTAKCKLVEVSLEELICRFAFT